MEVDETRFDRLHLHLLDVLHKLACGIAVRRDGRNLGLVNLLLIGVNTLALIHSDIVVAEVAVGEVNNLLLGHSADAVKKVHTLFPRLAIDKCLEEEAGSCDVILHGMIEVQLQVIDNTGQQVVAEVTLLQLLQFAQQQGTHLVECLPLTRRAGQLESRIVHQQLGRRPCLYHFHLLVDVQVE